MYEGSDMKTHSKFPATNKWDVPDSVSSPTPPPPFLLAPGDLLKIAAPALWGSHRLPFTQLESTALQEAGSALSHFLGGGHIFSIKIDVTEDGCGAEVNYDFPQDLREACRLSARNNFAATLFCALAGCPLHEDITAQYYAAAVDALGPLYATEQGWTRSSTAFWQNALTLICAPRVFRSAAMLAHRLIHQRVVDGMPDDCYSRDDHSFPELAAAEACLLHDLPRARQSLAAAVAGFMGKQVMGA